jgi:hypothetical protein
LSAPSSPWSHFYLNHSSIFVSIVFLLLPFFIFIRDVLVLIFILVVCVYCCGFDLNFIYWG